MERSYIQWNFVNWITIVLMVSAGWLVVGLVTSTIKARMGGGDA